MYYYILYMSAYPLLNYNWIDASSNMLPIANSTFAYGTCSLTTYNIDNANYWMPLPVTNVYSNNPNLVTKSTDGGLTFNVSGIYQLTNNLLFTGSGFSGTGTIYTFAFSYSDTLNTANTYMLPSAGTDNNINGPIYFLDGSTNTSLSTTPFFINGSCSGGRGNYANGYESTNYGGNVAAVSINGTAQLPSASNSPPFFLITNYSSASAIINTGNPNLPLNTVNATYYIPAGKTIYFNFTNASGGGNYLNASGNFTLQLLNYILVPSVVSSNLTVSSLQYSNGYYYYTFVPTAASNSATLTFPGNVQMNYFLVGGGGGGAGSAINIAPQGSSTRYNFSGGGGGGGQILNASASASTFNLTVGNGGLGGAITGSSSGGVYGVSSSSNSNLIGGSSSAGGSTILTTNIGTPVTATGGGGGSNNSTVTSVSGGGSTGGSAGGTGGGASGGNGLYTLYSNSLPQNTPTNGGSTTSVTLPFGTTYYVGGGGGGGGNSNYTTYSSSNTTTYYSTAGGASGLNNIGGTTAGNTATGQPGQPGLSSSISTSYGTGGGGGGFNYQLSSESYIATGGNGGPGFAVLYWKA